MAKNKKSQYQKQVAKERNNRQEKEYWTGFTSFMERLDLYQYVCLLPKSIIDSYIKLRISSIRMVTSSKAGIKNEDEKRLKRFLNIVSNKEWRTAYPNGATFTYKEYVIYLFYFFLTVKVYVDENQDEKIATAFKEMLLFTEENYDPLTADFQFSLNILTGWLSNPFTGHFHFNELDIQVKNDDGRTFSESWCSSAIFEYTYTEPVRRQLSIDGKKREVVQMAYQHCGNDLVWCTVLPSILNKPGETPILVYIQRHAINRTFERLDIIFKYLHYSIIITHSIAALKQAIQIGPNKYLIPTHFKIYKLGYMVASYVDDILVVTTFLFITQEGTPEGVLLDKLTGFERLDKSYLCIDKLSTFIQSDIASKPELVKLLQEANLGHLVDLHQHIRHICEKQKENLNDPSLIMEYIQRKRDEERLSVTEMQETK